MQKGTHFLLSLSLLNHINNIFEIKSLFSDGFGKVMFAHFLAVTTIGFIYATVMNYRRRNSKESKPSKYQNLVPLLERTESGRTLTLERFSNYVGNCFLNLIYS